MLNHPDGVGEHDAPIDAVPGAEPHLAVGNQFLLRFVEHLWARRFGLRIYEEQRGSADLIAMDADQHEAIAAAVEARDPALAERRTREHIAGAMRVLLESVLGAGAEDGEH